VGARGGESERAWIRARSGPLTPRRMAAALDRIAAFVAGKDHLAVPMVAVHGDPYAVLVSTVISLRTRDEVTDAVTPRLLAEAPTPEALACLPEDRIAALIYPACFYRTKGRTLRALGRTLVEHHGGQVPRTLDGLLALGGIGRKTANLVLTLGYGEPGICVDTHVHRIANRLGFVRTRTPDETERVLRARLPRAWWIPINDVLVSFGRTHCAPLSPRCSTCPVARTCLRAGVRKSR
jgi:endonuclease III